MNLGEMISDVRINIVDTSTVNPRLNDEKLTQIINAAIKIVALNTRAHTEDSEWTILDGLSKVALPAPIKDRFIGLRFVADKEFGREIHIRKMDEVNDHVAARIPVRTVPYICTVYNQEFHVAPAVFGNRVFKATVYSLPVALAHASLNVATTLPAQLHPIVVLYASSLAWRAFE